MPIYKGTANTESAYRGDVALDRIYKGSALVFESGATYEQTGTSPLTTSHIAKGKALIDYKIYGNSTQDGSPTPTNPVEIVSVGEQTANLYNDTQTRIANVDELVSADRTQCLYGNYNVYSWQPNHYITEGNYFNAAARSVCLPCSDGDTFTIYFFGSLPATPRYAYATIDSSGLVTSKKTYTVSNKKASVTAEYDGYMFIEWGISEELAGIVIAKNNSTLTQYVPYGFNIPIVVSGKNLFDASVCGSPMVNGVITTTTYSTSFTMGLANIKEIFTEPGDYTFSCKFNEGSMSSATPRIYINNDSSKVVRFNVQTGVATFTQQNIDDIQASTNESKFYIYSDMDATTNRAVITDFQIERGTAKTSYEPYVTPTTTTILLSSPLRRLVRENVSEYTDYIDFANQRVVRNVAKDVLGKTSNFAKFNSVTDYSAFYMAKDDLKNYEQGLLTNQPILSRTFEFRVASIGNANNSWSANYQISSAINNSYKRIMFALPNTITEVSDAKDWLSGNPVVYYYPTNPTNESVTLPSISTENGVTMFRVATTEPVSSMYIKYKGKK